MPPTKILVVDDQPVNVQLLKHKLERHGLTVRHAYSGPDALECIAEDAPDLIILDVMMPEMSGIEVCQILQSSDTHKSIPIIFATADTDNGSKLLGLNSGAVDYITKPLDLDELLAKVRTHLRLIAISREMVDLQHRLLEARRSATIGAMTQGIAHNMNNLLGIALGYLDLVKIKADNPEQVLINAEETEQALQKIVGIIKQLSSLAVKTRLPMEPYSLSVLLEGAVARFYQDYAAHPEIRVSNPLNDFTFKAHQELFEDLIGKLLMNATEACEDRPVSPIELNTSLYENKRGTRFVRIEILDRGHGIKPGIRDNMFEPFISSKCGVGVGMGLTVARNALRNIGGDLKLQDRPDGGTVAILLHPIDAAFTTEPSPILETN